MDSATLRDQLSRLARDHSWTWSATARQLWSRLDDAAFHRHPVQIVSDISKKRYDALLADNDFMTELSHEAEKLHAMLEQDGASPRIAYFCAEFGMSEVINQFAGGLGVLAGDYLKAASDLSLPLVGVGLFYRDGFFKQHVEDGRQGEHYQTVEPESVGAVDTEVVVDVPMPGRDVAARVWANGRGAHAVDPS